MIKGKCISTAFLGNEITFPPAVVRDISIPKRNDAPKAGFVVEEGTVC